MRIPCSRAPHKRFVDVPHMKAAARRTCAQGLSPVVTIPLAPAQERRKSLHGLGVGGSFLGDQLAEAFFGEQAFGRLAECP